MTNNLKEIENILDFTITYRFYDEVPSIQDRLLEFRGKITEEASERILALINQKEKEGAIKVLEEVRREVNYRLSNDLQIAELERDQYATVVEVEEKVIEDRIKQLKEELKGGKQ